MVATVSKPCWILSSFYYVQDAHELILHGTRAGIICSFKHEIGREVGSRPCEFVSSLGVCQNISSVGVMPEQSRLECSEARTKPIQTAKGCTRLRLIEMRACELSAKHDPPETTCLTSSEASHLRAHPESVGRARQHAGVKAATRNSTCS